MKRYILQKPGKKEQFLISIVLVVMIAALGFSLHSLLGYKVVAFMLLVTVSILAMFLDIVPVLLAACLSAFIWDFFFIPPRFTLTVGNAEDRFLFLMYFIVSLINAVLTYKIRRREKIIKLKSEKENEIKFYNTLLNSLSHELRTPITTIIGSVDNLQNNSPKLSEKDKADLLTEISVAAIRLNQHVENLLSMSRLESGIFQIKTDWCDINDLIYKTLNRLEPNLQKNKVIVHLPDQLPLFKLDFGLIEQVIYNLIFNVTLHTPPDTTITINVRGISDKLFIVISDNGPGFPNDEIDKVFNKFYRVKGSNTGGTGLGLSIVKGFVEAHQGTIQLKNLPTLGAEFTIEIPAQTSILTSLENE